MNSKPLVTVPIKFRHFGGSEIKAIIDFFDRREVSLSGPDVNLDALSLVNSQSSYQEWFINYVRGWARNAGKEFDELIEAVLEKIVLPLTSKADSEAEAKVKAFDHKASHGRQIVFSNSFLPIIDKMHLASITQKLGEPERTHVYSQYASDLVLFVSAIYIKRSREVVDFVPPEDLLFSRLGAAFRTVDSIENLHLSSEAEFEASHLRSTFQTIDVIIDDAKQRVFAINDSIKDVAKAVESNRAKLEIFVGRVFEQHVQLDEFIAGFEEKLKFKEARKLWSKRSENLSIAFYSTFILLVVILSSIPVFAVGYRTELIIFFRNLETLLVAGANGNSEVATTVSALGKLLFFSAPLGFVVWLIRLLVRFNMRSLMMMDDAQTRVTMLDTYFYMISQDAAVKQDRGAILEALFRRPPGHGDDAEPPHFTDLLKYGQEGSKS